MRINILVLNGVFDTGLTAVLDAFGTANALAEMTGISSLRFQIKVVGLRKRITTAHGLSVPVVTAARAQTPDAVVMPAILHLKPEPLVKALAGSEVREAGAVLRKWSERGALTATACWLSPLCSMVRKPPPLGGYLRCSDSAIRACGWTNLAFLYNPTPW